jgi:cytochrome c551/c552
MSQDRLCQQAIVLLAVIVCGCQPIKELPEEPLFKFDPALTRSPPEVEQASIEILKAPNYQGNARLRVQFKQSVRKRSLVIQGGQGPTLLRDDGLQADQNADDGMYSAFVNFDQEAYEAEWKRRAEIAREGVEVPLFKNRKIVGKRRLDLPPFKPLKPGQIVPLFLFDGMPSPLISAAAQLVITDVRVVDDPTRTFNPCTNTNPGTPMGPWTFGKLMTEMANEQVTGIHPSDFTLRWLQHWSTNQVINTFTVGHRTLGLNDRVLTPWPKLSDGRLDLSKAPFRLLAIVNRIDLRTSTTYGSGDAGEARFVFGLISCDPQLQTDARMFTVIFEYGIKKNSCSAVRDWAQQWIDLGSPSDGLYNQKLQAITDQFTLSNAAPSKLPNRSALNQLRTNEFAIAQFPADTFWELREFKICSDASGCGLGYLEQTTIAQTPDVSFQGDLAKKPLLRDFVNNNEADVLAGRHLVPLQLPPATPFRGGAIEPGGGFPWNPGGITSSEARHIFSLATCNGCHTRETGTMFLHIAPRLAGNESALSDFLTGMNQPVADPVTTGVNHTFHDLLDRQLKLDATANMACRNFSAFPTDDLFSRPVPFVH